MLQDITLSFIGSGMMAEDLDIKNFSSVDRIVDFVKAKKAQ